jgi:peptide/nickel transport system substrate-binding protein
MIIESYGLGPDPDIGVERLYNSGNILSPPQPFTNSSGYTNPEIDRMFEEQRAQPDLASRKKMYDRIQEVIWQDLPVLPIFAYLQVNIYRSSYVTDIFNTPASNYENFADAKLL